MRTSAGGQLNRAAVRLRARAQALWRNRRGAASIEFALVVTPFITLILGIICVAMYAFQVSSIEGAALQAARAIRTGQLQQGQGSYTGLTTDTDKKAAFLTSFCKNAIMIPNCASKTSIIVQSSTQFASLTSPNCTSNGSIVPQSGTTFSPGATNNVVMVTVCYPWSFPGGIAFNKLGGLSDGSFLVQATVAFRTEPY